MQRLGRVLHVSSSRNIIVKTQKRPPKIGDRIVDENLTPLGRVFDIFGPVKSPYVSIRPEIKDPERLVNHVVYAVPSPHKNWKRKKRK